MEKANMTLEDHQKMMADTQNLIRNMFNDSDDGSLMPALHVIDKDGKMILCCLALNFSKEEEKDMIEKMMVTFALQGAQALIFISEAWTLSGDAESWKRLEQQSHSVTETRHPIPSQSPERIEVISLMYGTPEREWITNAKIFRPPNGKPFVAGWEDPYGGLGSEERKTFAEKASRPSLKAGRFNSSWLKAERLRRLCDARAPGYIELMLAKFEKMGRGADELDDEE